MVTSSSPPSGEKAAITLLSIPLKYTYLAKPSSDPKKGHSVYYETATTTTNNTIWRPVDTNDTSGEFKQTLNAATFTDNLPSLRNVTSAISTEGQIKARLMEDRILENTLTINLAGPGNLVSAERARVLRSYYQVERRHIGLDAEDILNPSYNPNDKQPAASEDATMTDASATATEEADGAKGTKKKTTRKSAAAAAKKINRSGDPTAITPAEPVTPSALSNKSQASLMFKPKLLSHLDEISDYCGVSIFVTDFIDKIPYGIGYHTELNSESATKPYHILIYGDQDSARFAELKVKILLEEIKGNFIDSIPLDLSLQPLVAGPHLTNFSYIERVTRTKIFVPEWLPELFASLAPNPNARNVNEIYVTGEEFHVLLAKIMLTDIITRTQPLVKDCVISFAKIDLLSLRFQDNLRKIMTTHGTFIQIPYLGAARAVIRVQSTSVPICALTINELMSLTTLLYNATYWVHTGESDAQGKLQQPNIPINFDILDRISAGSGATVVCKNTSFDIIGFKSDTKRAVAMIKSLPIWGDSKEQVRYRVELSNEQREFISGKKNGKIIRIMNTSRVWIKLLPFNEYNFYVDIYSEHPPEATNGLKLLEEELPAELAFYIPETYHKKVIGAGGSTVQGIMRKYNVFIKFSSGYDVNPNGYSRLKSTNVLIRCPTKNSKEMEPAKNELLETVYDRSQEHGTTFVKLSRSYMRILLSHHVDFISEIEAKSNTIIKMPTEEHYEDLEQQLEIRGLMGTSDAAARLLKTKLPEDYEFKVAYSSKFHELVNEGLGEFYQKIIVPFRIALKIETLVNEKPDYTSEESEEAPYHQILLSFAQENSVGLEDAIQVLTAFLRDKGLDIIDRGEYHVDPIIPGVAGIAPPLHSNKRRMRPGPAYHKGGYDSRDAGGPGYNPRDRYNNRSLPIRGGPNRFRGRSDGGYERHQKPHDNGGGHGRDSSPMAYRHEEIRNSSHPYRKGPMSTPSLQRRSPGGPYQRYGPGPGPGPSNNGSAPAPPHMEGPMPEGPTGGYYEDHSRHRPSYSSQGYRSPPSHYPSAPPPPQHNGHHHGGHQIPQQPQSQPHSYSAPPMHHQQGPPMPPPGPQSQGSYDQRSGYQQQQQPQQQHQQQRFYQSGPSPMQHQHQHQHQHHPHHQSRGGPGNRHNSGGGYYMGNENNNGNNNSSGYQDLPPPPPPPVGNGRGGGNNGRYQHQHRGGPPPPMQEEHVGWGSSNNNNNKGQQGPDRYGRSMDPLPPPPPPPSGPSGPSGNGYDYDRGNRRYNNY